MSMPLSRSEAKDLFTTVLKPTLAMHCVKCHGQQGKVKGEVDLLKINSRERP